MQSRERQKYRKLLLNKLEELSAISSENESVVPAAGSRHGDLADQANSDTEAELQIRLHQTDIRLTRAIDEAMVRLNKDTFGTCAACKQPISRPV
jgi:RNA polymerase-binding transcription factor DksA